MTDEQWRRVKDEFEQARDAPLQHRDLVLAAVADPAVRHEVEDLLRAYDGSQDFLESPAILSSDLLPLERSASGQRLGNYVLIGQVGEGGMGVVYEAMRADGEFEQRVAIKIMKFWLTSSRETARFRAERQILARLDHPNIARLIDGGTTPDGLPFLVMEFVDGIRIDEYCKKQDLDIRGRLQLFRQVCEAVEYAHAQGVVHRDLKPANVLVRLNGSPKLLDFGIAQVVDPDAAQTATLTLTRPATPQYASPEQLQGEPTTPASDIYSLGVLLYELITGQSPYAGKTDDVHLISRAVYEARPPAPSEITGNRAWKRTLDRVVVAAMEKNPGARYTSVKELITDVDHYLNGTEITARRRYRKERTGRSVAVVRDVTNVWRRPMVWAAMLVAFAMVSIVLVRSGPSIFRPKSAFEQLYEQGMERQQHFDYPAARSLFRRAVDADPKNPLGHYAYSAALHTLGYESIARREAKLANDWSSGLSMENQLLIKGRYQEYTGDRRGAVNTYQKLWSANRNNLDYGLRFAAAQVSAGSPADALRTLESIRGVHSGSTDEARIFLQRARAFELQSKYQQELHDAAAAVQIADKIAAGELKAEALQVQGDALRLMDRSDEATDVYAQSEALSRENGDLYQVASIENRLGNMFFNKGDYSALETHANTALALFKQIDNKTAQASILNNLSLAQKSRGNLSEALAMLEQALEISRQAGDLDMQAGELTNMGTTLRRLGRTADARKAFEESLQCAEQLGHRDQIARSHVTLEVLDRDDGDLNGALAHIRTALNLLADSKAVALKSLTWQHLGDDIHASGNLEEAKTALEQSMSLARQSNARQLLADDAYMLADIAREQRDFQHGEGLLREAENYYVAQKQKVNLWDAWITEDRLRISEGHSADTEKISAAVDGFRGAKDKARECGGDSVLMEAYLAQSKVNQAARVLKNSHALCATTGEYESRMMYKIRSIQVEAALGDAARAKQELQSLARELEAKGWRQLAREATTAPRKSSF